MSRMNKLIESLTAVVIAAAASQTYAQEYVGGNASFSEVEIEGAGDASSAGLSLRLGTMYNDYLSAEVRAGAGIGEDEIGDTEIRLQSLVGIYLRAGLPTGGRFYPYAVLGYTRGEVSADTDIFSTSTSDSSMSYGIGTDFHINNRLDINAEYMQYMNKGNIEIHLLSVGAAYSF